jgi:predicted GNAT family acetyltransferase
MNEINPVVDNPSAGRFELTIDGRTAFAAYTASGRSIVFTHTEVPAEMQGKGVGSTLARGALDAARSRNAEVVPLCPFMASFIRSHPQYLDLVSARNRQRLKLEHVDDRA